MENALDWGLRLLVIGMGVWALKAYLSERTKRIKASDQFLTQCEITKLCEKYKESILNETENDMSHVRELIEKDLDRGEERFAKLDNRLEKLEEKYQITSDTLITISISLKQLIQNTKTETHA